MSKIVAFFGSPRENGFSAKLVRRVIEGAKSAGAEVTTYDLNAEGIRGCQSCYFCRENEGCAVKDPLHAMYEDIKAADGIVASFPNYFNDICGQAKLWIDRLFPMMNSDFSPRCPGKKAVTVFSQANPNGDMYKTVYDATNKVFELFAWKVAGSLMVYGTDSPEYEIPSNVMDEAFECGKRLVK